jgi:hypothetical protein
VSGQQVSLSYLVIEDVSLLLEQHRPVIESGQIITSVSRREQERKRWENLVLIDGFFPYFCRDREFDALRSPLCSLGIFLNIAGHIVTKYGESSHVFEDLLSVQLS